MSASLSIMARAEKVKEMESDKRVNRKMQGELRREQLIEFILNYIDENGYAPTYREIANGVGINHKAVYNHLHTLEREGRITLGSGGRTIVVIR